LKGISLRQVLQSLKWLNMKTILVT